MWNRIQLKTNAKRILFKNYLLTIIVTLILMVASSGISIIIPQSQYGYNSTSESNVDPFAGIDDTSSPEEVMNQQVDLINEYYKKAMTFLKRQPVSVLISMVWIIIAVIILAILLQTFILEPLHVGCKRWFVKNRTISPKLSEIVFVFKNGYLNVAKTMFLKNLFLTFWSVVFIIPGIVKMYEYRMIPYLLAENPDMDWHTAFDKSRRMMYGNKWNTFVLDLSFIGWEILAAITWGIFNLMYVAPYKQLTNTELYAALSQTNNDGYSETYNNEYQEYNSEE